MKIVANLMLIFCAAIWGGSFVAQRIAMDYVGPYTFSAARFFLGGCSLIPLVMFRSWQAKKWPGAASVISAEREDQKPITGKLFFAAVVLCGLINGTGSTLVQIGLIYTTASKAGFLTAIYIVFVPIVGMMFFRKKTGVVTWSGVGLALVGLYLLCMSGKMNMESGDLIILASTFFFATHIHLIAKVSPRVDSIKFVCFEFIFSGLFFFILALMMEEPTLRSVLNCGLSLVYASVFAVGVCYCMQVIAQRYTDPTVAALLMSLEAVFSAICGVLLLNETMSLRELIGSLIVMLAVIIAQLPDKRRGDSSEHAEPTAEIVMDLSE